MNKVTVAVIIVIVLLFGGVVASHFLQQGIDFEPYNSAKIIAADENNGEIADHVRGNKDSQVVLVEYADLQCPGCSAIMPRISEMTKQYGDRVAFIFRSFPISGHQNARAASTAAEAAGFQGYFWEMVETLYSNQASWEYLNSKARTDEFVRVFQQIAPNGDVEKFRNDLNDKRIDQKISFDYNIGLKKDSINATPAFVINGKRVDASAANTQDEFRDAIEKLLKEELEKAGLDTEPNYDYLVTESQE